MEAKPRRDALDLEEWANANVPRRYSRGDLNLIPDEAQHKRWLFKWVKRLHEIEPTGVGLVIAGPHGTGKSTIACQLLGQIMRRGPLRCYYVDAADIPGVAIRQADTALGENEWRLLCGGAQVLVIDDLGIDGGTDWSDRSYRNVLNKRYGHERMTIITTNLEDRDLERRVQRVSQVFSDAYEWLTIPGPYWREEEE